MIPKVDEKFAELFDIPTFGVPQHYYENNGSKPSKFERHCNDINSYFNKKWKSLDVRASYLTTFSTAKWKAMSTNEKQKHTLANCATCYHTAGEQQANFPQKPINRSILLQIQWKLPLNLQ